MQEQDVRPDDDINRGVEGREKYRINVYTPLNTLEWRQPMKFVSVNEIDRFKYNDCVITDVNKTDNGLEISLEALIVMANNSQNGNFTDSYAGDSLCSIKDIHINKILKIGYRYYDADDKLVSEIPDEELSADTDICELMKGMYLYRFEKKDDELYHLEIETVQEDISLPTDAYELILSASEIEIGWDKYMNRVQN